MWSDSVGFALALFVAGHAAAATVSCPSYVGEHALESAQLFDGPPADKADLVSDDGSWDLTPYKGRPARYYLLCHFSHTAETKLVTLPLDVSACKTSLHAGATSVDCK